MKEPIIITIRPTDKDFKEIEKGNTVVFKVGKLVDVPLEIHIKKQ